MVKAFTVQVVAPAIAIAGGHETDIEPFMVDRPGPVAHALLCGARSLPRILELSRRWHARQHAMDAEISKLSPDLTPSSLWPVGLPDWQCGDISLRVLSSKSELDDEGRRGSNADGSGGLWHCVGGYSESCRSGAIRIVSLRRTFEDGTFERLSTAEVTVSQHGTCAFEPVQHSGMLNGIPAAECAEALNGYLAALRSQTIAVDHDGLAPLRTRASVAENAGYEWHVPGNWEAAMAQWAEFLPRPVRAWTPKDFARLASASVNRRDAARRATDKIAGRLEGDLAPPWPPAGQSPGDVGLSNDTTSFQSRPHR